MLKSNIFLYFGVKKRKNISEFGRILWNKCKSGKVTSLGVNEQKCCYVHLKYKNNEESEERDEYKCLEFSKSEKKSYEDTLKEKYINPLIEFDNCEFPE